MIYCRILPITKCESLFKKPCDSKMLDIFKAIRTSSFKRKTIDKDSILKKLLCITYKNDYILLHFVSSVRWDNVCLEYISVKTFEIPVN